MPPSQSTAEILYSNDDPAIRKALFESRHSRPYPIREYARSPLDPSQPDILVIVGCPRSGTTYLREILAYAVGFPLVPEVQTVKPLHDAAQRGKFGDLRTIEGKRRLAAAFLSGQWGRRMNGLFGLPITVDDLLERFNGDSFAGALRAVVQLNADVRPIARRLGYKYPGDVFHMPLISQLLPTARFIHVIRDGRDVARSVIAKPWGTTNYFASGIYWRWHVEAGQKHGAALGPSRYTEFHYETMMREPEKIGGQLTRFITGDGADQTAAFERWMHYFEQTGKTERSQAWKTSLTPHQCRQFESYAGGLLRKLGYETEFDGKPIPLPEMGALAALDVLARRYRQFKQRLSIQ